MIIIIIIADRNYEGNGAYVAAQCLQFIARLSVYFDVYSVNLFVFFKRKCQKT